MTNPNEDLLTTEGVDEGSAASTVEGARTAEGASSAGGSAGGDRSATGATGHGPKGAARDEADPAPPVDMETPESRSTRATQGPGQQLEAGEG